MNKKEQKEAILSVYKQFNEQLGLIDVSALKDHFSREELLELNQEIRSASLSQRHIISEIHELTETMKREERPQLLGVYRFPILNEIDFLPQDVKVALDKHLSKRFKNQIDVNLGNIVCGEAETKTLEWLLDKEVLRIDYHLECDNWDCNDQLYSVYSKQKFLELIESYKEATNAKNNYERMSEEERMATSADAFLDYLEAESTLEQIEEEFYCEGCDTHMAKRVLLGEERPLTRRLTMNINPDFSLEKN